MKKHFEIYFYVKKRHFTINLRKKIFTIYFHEKYMVFEFTHKTTRELLLTKFKVFREKLTTGGGYFPKSSLYLSLFFPKLNST